MNDELRKAVLDFIANFEEVFDKDWDYTKQNLGIYRETAQEKRERLKSNEEDDIYWIHPEGTFINPQVEDEIEDWGYRGGLLMTYRKLKQLLAATE